MPRITCPNCGMTINLENRKEIDFDLITAAAKKRPRTFTEFLRITRLPRKTLSLRLKELCKNGVLAKGDGMYKLNGVFESKNNGRDLMRGFSRALHNRRMRVGLMLIAFLLCSSVSGYVLARFLMQSQPPRKQVIGNFMMSLDISNVKDLYAWQVVITFNPSELKVTKITPGDFVRIGYPFFTNATNTEKGVLILGGTLYGSTPGKSGSSRLATIVFGYFVYQYKNPRIASKIGRFETQLWDSESSIISNSNSTLKLTIIENS